MKEEHKVKESPVWLTIYSDLMTNLMLFFLMLYGITRLSISTQSNLLQAIQNEFAGEQILDNKKQAFWEQVGEELKKYLEEETEGVSPGVGGKKNTTVMVEENLIRIVLEDPVLFDIGSADLLPAAVKVLHKISMVIKDVPNPVIIEGFTDNLPITGGKFRSNWDLSLARANAVYDYFIEKEGLPGKNFSIAGYGPFRPRVANDSAEHRAFNRRIEISLVRL